MSKRLKNCTARWHRHAKIGLLNTIIETAFSSTLHMSVLPCSLEVLKTMGSVMHLIWNATAQSQLQLCIPRGAPRLLVTYLARFQALVVPIQISDLSNTDVIAVCSRSSDCSGGHPAQRMSISVEKKLLDCMCVQV